ncbi:flippase-like domain-containing protein [candidate division KSB1 bacterium]|nr:flippase-like domain-containing protein [candidate division KSB1 bacterium]
MFYKLGLSNVLNQVKTARLSWFLTGTLLFLGSNILASLQWHMLLKLRGVGLPFRRVISYYFVGMFFNNFLMGQVGGDAFRIYDISRSSGQSEAAVSSVFFDRFIGFAILTSMALCAALYWSQFMDSNGIVIIIGLIFLGWLILFLILFNPRLVKSIAWIFDKFLSGKWRLKIKEIYLGIHNFKHHKQQLTIIILISCITQFLRILVHFAAARSIGVNIDLVYFIIFIPVIALISSLPISIGGIGIRESSAVALFAPVWEMHADIVAFEFLSFLISVITALPGGILFMIRKEHKPNIPKENFDV